MTALARVVATSHHVAATPKRSEKTEALARLLRALEGDEVETVVAWLSGEPRQGKIGVGWAQLQDLVAGGDAATVTVLEVDRAFDDLAGVSGPGSKGRRAAILQAVARQTTPAELAFITRILLGDMRQGALAGLLADAVAKAAAVKAPLVRRAAMLAGDLPAVAALALARGERALAEIGLRVGRPLAPMLASTAGDVAEALDAIGGPASVEWKLDGARVQVHRNADVVQIFTRNLNDVTARLPGVVAAARELACDRVILDGEVMGGALDDDPERFQDLMARFGSDGPATGLSAYFFDCLHVDGQDLIDEPLRVRRAALADLAPGQTVPGRPVDDVAEAGRVLDEALDAGHEGVMVKDLESPYAAGRRGKAWRKVKPVITLDLVVIGVEWGHGRRTGKLSNLHLGARAADGQFVMVGKTFKGLTDEMLEWQTERFLELEQRREGIAVMVRPEQVVEIAVDGVQASTRYPGGVALRFARVRRYRSDKAAAQADTIETVQRLLGRPRA